VEAGGRRSHLISADKAFLLPVVIDDTSDDDERAPERFREVQWTRLPGCVTPTAFVERILRLLSGETARRPKGTASAAARVPAPPPTRKSGLASWRSKPALLATIAVLVLALGYLVANRLVLSKRGAAVGSAPEPAAQSASATAFNPPPHSIAVLPFTNLSGDPKEDYFSDGVSEELINALAHIDALQVTGRSSSFSFRGQNVDVGPIARKLNVSAILEGSIRRQGNTVRITAQLINAVNGYHLWSEDYDRDLKNILLLQTDIATSVAQQLRVRLLGDEIAKMEADGTRDPRAYDEYLRGAHLMDTAEGTAFRVATSAFEQAIALDPGYARAHAARAIALIDDAVFDPDVAARDRTRKDALRSAEQAVRLAPESANAHVALWLVRALGIPRLSGRST
jgi:TolB-like protein